MNLSFLPAHLRRKLERLLPLFQLSRAVGLHRTYGQLRPATRGLNRAVLRYLTHIHRPGHRILLHLYRALAPAIRRAAIYRVNFVQRRLLLHLQLVLKPELALEVHPCQHAHHRALDLRGRARVDNQPLKPHFWRADLLSGAL